MPKVVDDHRERNLRSYIAKRTTKNPRHYIQGKLGVTDVTATKYLKDPLTMRVGDLLALKLSDEELLGVIK